MGMLDAILSLVRLFSVPEDIGALEGEPRLQRRREWTIVTRAACHRSPNDRPGNSSPGLKSDPPTAGL